jgi:hypothetical protein
LERLPAATTEEEDAVKDNGVSRKMGRMDGMAGKIETKDR